MTGRFQFQKLAKYPHMKPEDVAVWERFIEKNPDYFDSVDYDVCCGKGVEPTGAHDANIESGYQMLTQKKIDVVGYKNGRTTVIEVGPIADMRKLGQAMTYSMLYAEDHPEQLPIERMVIAGKVDRDMPAIYAAHQVLVETA